MRNPSADQHWPPLDGGTRIIRLFAWLTKAKYTHGAMVIVRNGGGDLLLVQERFRERGSWGLPGGFLHLHETARQAAARELREEVGIAITESLLEPVDQYQQPWAWHYDHLFALTSEQTGTGRAGKELRGYAWFSLAEIPPLTRAADYALHRSGLLTAASQPADR